MQLWLIIGLAVLLLIIIISAIRILKEYERGVIFRFGRLVGMKGPGIILLIPLGIDKMVRVSLRVITMDIPPQDIITKDNVTVEVNAVAYFRVMDASKAVVEVQDYMFATSQISQTTLRSVLGEYELDDLLTDREVINERLQKIIDKQTDPWGIKISMVEIKDVNLPEEMRRAIARQAEAERERRAKVIHADGEFQASEKLSQAATILDRTPSAIQLRFLGTLTEIAAEKNSTIVFPVPIDLLKAWMQKQTGEIKPKRSSRKK
ncbi:slipin family protein [candidate division WOR-3 bacterium]|uniref:Slipin family protein n=1 Tax=candidate division WOR-3 bacterium TaxID=2052148 RepID=A0A9D5QCR2_UNCW3|nr:slipin family protein [candidate division WOR-3 bacterium]MBD3364948.1 slipin family protein [candidate division WOR-3 bacterium]